MKKLYAVLFCAAMSFNASAAGNISKGQAVAERLNCASCHGKDFKSPTDPSYPKLAGQHRDYLEHALTAYKRGNAANGRNNGVMVEQVKLLSDQDIKDLAAYFHSLPGTLVTHR